MHSVHFLSLHIPPKDTTPWVDHEMKLANEVIFSPTFHIRKWKGNLRMWQHLRYERHWENNSIEWDVWDCKLRVTRTANWEILFGQSECESMASSSLSLLEIWSISLLATAHRNSILLFHTSRVRVVQGLQKYIPPASYRTSVADQCIHAE
jgi:hypothetical protein